MKFMFSYQLLNGQCGNICRDSLTDLAVDAQKIPGVKSFTVYYYYPHPSGLSNLEYWDDN